MSNKKTTTLTIPEYAKKVKNCSRQAVFQAIRDGKLQRLPGVIGYKKIGRDYHLEVSS